MTDKENIDTIVRLRLDQTNLWNAICDLQFDYARKLLTENKEANMHTAEVYLTFISDLQKLIDR